MAHAGRECREGLDGPFLDAGFDSPGARRSAIADEVQYYIMVQGGMGLPPDVTPSEELPDCLYWLLTTEQWGLPYHGGHLEQPWFFMLDIEAAALGRSRVAEIRDANARLKQRQGSDAWPRSQIT